MNSIYCPYNVLYYSNMCDCSKELIAILQREDIYKYLHTICIDNNTNIPPNIKTPTIIIKGSPTPYILGDAFLWVARMKQRKENIIMRRMNNNQLQYIRNINNNLMPAENEQIKGFSEAEMSGMSDMFSLFSLDQKRECHDAFPQSFVTCQNIGKQFIETLPLENGSYKISKNNEHKITEKQQEKMVKSLESLRQEQDNTFKSYFDEYKKQTYC